MYNSGVKALDAVNPLSLSSEDSFSKLNIEDEEESKSAVCRRGVRGSEREGGGEEWVRASGRGSGRKGLGEQV